MIYTISQIASATGIRLPHRSDRAIDTLLTDSRSLSRPSSTIFFAIHTASNDGHRYIGQLYRQGVRAFVVDYWDPQWRDMDADFLVAPNGVMSALQQLAAYHRAHIPQATVVGITGSRGKTIVKEWLAETLPPFIGNVTRSPRSYNSQIGVPLSLWLMNPDTNLAIFEAGISRPGEMANLARMIAPDVAVLTNIHDEHGESFASNAAKCREKALLLRDAKAVVYCADDPLVADIISEGVPRSESLCAWTLHDAPSAKIRFKAEKLADGTTRLTLPEEKPMNLPHLPSQPIFGYDIHDPSSECLLGFTDDESIENACHTAATMMVLGIDSCSIANALKWLHKVNTRTDVLEGRKGSLIIRDHYKSDTISLEPAIDFMNRRLSDPSLSTILMASNGENDSKTGMYNLAEILSLRHIDTLIGIGNNFFEYEPLLGKAVRHLHLFHDEAQLAAALANGTLDITGRTILVKGNSDVLDKVTDLLQARRHETVLEVNLDDLVWNYNFYRRRLADPATGIVCMVKASGYGAGAYARARTLQAQGAAYLAVAVLDEGVDLRRAGITMPIMVLNPRVVNYDELFSNHLEPEIFSFEELDAIVANARRHGIKRYPVHIKLDTGMHRLGFIGEEIPELIERLKAHDEVEPVSVFSHLAAADDPSMDDYTLEQFSKFDAWSGMLRAQWPQMKRHILNSTGITRFPEKQYEMVRLGICLYGIATMADGSQDGLRPVSSLHTSIIALRTWPEGTTIGYNRRGLCRRTTRVATIPVGYADGINRHLGNGGMRVSVNGRLCPTIGNICMDACMIDVTDCGSDVAVGDSVEIFGRQIPVTELSDTLGTIPYEILTSVSTRVKRVYYQE